MSSQVVEGKELDPDDKAYIQKQVAENHQDIFFQDWITLYYSDKTPKKRILVITNFRIYTIKVNLLGARSVRQAFPILDLQRMHCAKDNLNRLVLEFPAPTWSMATIQYENGVQPIAQAILFSYQACTFGRPQSMLPKIELPGEFMASYLPPEPDEQDGLLATYLAECDYNKLEQRLPVLDYLMTSFQLNDRALDMGECFSFIRDDSTKTDIIALSNALRFSRWFREISAVNFPVKNEGLVALSNLLSVSTALEKLIMVNTKAGPKGLTALAAALTKGVHSLSSLNLGKNPLGDPGIQQLCDGLREGKKVLSTLCLRNCGFQAKGFKSLTTLLEQPAWAAGLKILDVSENRMSKAGTQAIADWLKVPGVAVEQLYLVSCEIEPDILFEGLEANKKLYTEHLKTLNLSGNKLTQKSVSKLGAIIEQTKSMTSIFLSNAQLGKFFTEIIDHVFKNKHTGVHFSLDFSNNKLEKKGAKDLETLFAEWLKKDPRAITDGGKLHTLVLSENDLGADGIITLCKALKGTSVNSLGIDRNVKLGMFGSGKEVGDALAALIAGTPLLKELTVAGGGSFNLQNALLPLVEALKDNTSLHHLDMSKNKMGEPGIIKLAESLAENNALRSFNVEGNKLGLQSLQAIHEAVMKNRSLVDWSVPMDDIQKLVKQSNDKRVKDLRQLVHDIDLKMEKNAQGLKPEKETKSPNVPSSMSFLSVSVGVVGEVEGRLRGASRMNAMDDPSLSIHRKNPSRLFESMVTAEMGAAPPPSVMVPPTPHAASPASPTQPDGDSKVARPPPSLSSPTRALPPGGRAKPPVTPSSPAPEKTPEVITYDDWTAASYSFEDLSAKSATELPKGVDPEKRELYLEASKFQEIFGMTKQEHAALPKWKQQAVKKAKNLY